VLSVTPSRFDTFTNDTAAAAVSGTTSLGFCLTGLVSLVSFSALMLLAEWQEGHLVCKKMGLGGMVEVGTG